MYFYTNLSNMLCFLRLYSIVYEQHMIIDQRVIVNIERSSMIPYKVTIWIRSIVDWKIVETNGLRLCWWNTWQQLRLTKVNDVYFISLSRI